MTLIHPQSVEEVRDRAVAVVRLPTATALSDTGATRGTKYATDAPLKEAAQRNCCINLRITLYKLTR